MTFLLVGHLGAAAAPAAVSADGSDAEADLVAVSTTGDARAATWCASPVDGASWLLRVCLGGVAVSGTGDADGLVAASGAGQATGVSACPTEGTYWNGVLVCPRGIAVSGLGEAHGERAAVSAGDNATVVPGHGVCEVRTFFGVGLLCHRFALSGLGNASAPYAVSGAGEARGETVVSGANRCNGRACVAVSPEGNASGHYLGVSGTGRAEGQRAVSLAGEADGGIAASGTGRAEGDGVAASGTGDAEGTHAVSGTGTAGREDRYSSLVVSGTGRAQGCSDDNHASSPCKAVSGTGDADAAFLAVSVTGHASCGFGTFSFYEAVTGSEYQCLAVSVLGTADGERNVEGCRAADGAEAACALVRPLLP